MNRQISFRQYRAIDLGIMGALLVLSQSAISIFSATVYADQLYVVSTVAAVTALVMMRWNGWAAIHAAVGGLVVGFFGNATPGQYVIYCLGNQAALLGLLLFRWLGKEKIRKDALTSMFFALCTQVLMQLGRAAVALLLGADPAACFGFITTDSLSILFTVVVIWVARRIEGLFEDQKHYLLRIQSEANS